MTKQWNREGRISEAAKEWRLEQRIEEEWTYYYGPRPYSPLWDAFAKVVLHAAAMIAWNIAAAEQRQKQRQTRIAIDDGRTIDATLEILGNEE